MAVRRQVRDRIEMKKKIRLVIADDHPLFRAGVRAALEDVDDIEIVGEAEAGPKVLPLLAQTKPDFLLLDYLMPKFDGLACLDAIQERHPTLKVAIISGVDEGRVIEAALSRGASAFVLKSISPEDVAGVIRQVIHGTVFLAQARVENGSAPVEDTGPAGLTERETSILVGLARGLSNEAIAKELWITRDTVKFHIRKIYRKLDVTNRTEAARYAYQHGLVRNSAAEVGAAQLLSAVD